MSNIINYFSKMNFETLGLDFSIKLVVVIFLWLMYSLLKKLMYKWFKKILSKSANFAVQSQGRQETLVKLLQNVLDYSLGFLFLYWILSMLGFPIGSLLAGAGLAGIAIGLGAQGFLTDLVNGFFILFEHQFDVGDTIQVFNIKGVVTSIGLRTTQLKSSEGIHYFIPNRNITLVGNCSRYAMTVRVDLPVSFDSDLKKVEQIIQKTNDEHLSNYPEIIKPPNILGATTLASGSSVFRIELTIINGKQTEIYHKFCRLYQDELRKNSKSL